MNGPRSLLNGRADQVSRSTQIATRLDWRYGQIVLHVENPVVSLADDTHARAFVKL